MCASSVHPENATVLCLSTVLSKYNCNKKWFYSMSGFGFLGVGYARKNPLPFPYGNESMQLRDEILRDLYALL